MKNLKYLLNKHSPSILTGLGVLGVVSTTILAVKATPKALELIKNEEQLTNQSLTNIEIIKIAWKPYIPSLICCIGTISCILSAHYLNRKTQASITAAYTLLSNSYKTYIKKVKELYGDESHNIIREEIAKEYYKEYGPTHPVEDDVCTFFDYQSLTYFESTIDNVLEAENLLNQEYAASGYTNLKQFYKNLGIDNIPLYASEVGWYGNGEYEEITFEHRKVVMDDGMECWHIYISNEPIDLVETGLSISTDA